MVCRIITYMNITYEPLTKILSKKKFAVLCHSASVNIDGIHILQWLEQKKIKPQAIFTPEHGLFGEAQDMASVKDNFLQNTKCYSLYGDTFESLKPTKEMLKDIECIIIDLQDIGSRYYTYIWTAFLVMKECATLGISIYVIDRPNPITGLSVSGGVIEKGFESFVGLLSLPTRHGLTIGEILSYIKNTQNIDVNLDIIQMKGWKRSFWFDDTNALWVFPSPNMPTLDTAILYPGLCLIEGTNLSEGRGTTKPFELVGAPFLDEWKFAKKLNYKKLEGVYFRPQRFLPTHQKYKNISCGGVQIHILNRNTINPILVGMAVIETAYELSPEQFRWRNEKYEFIDTIPAIDLLIGNSTFRKCIEQKISICDFYSEWDLSSKELKEHIKHYYLYE